jgi:acyl-CoA thioesterase
MNDAGAFFAPTATHNPLRWYLPVEPRLCVGPPERKFLFGGVGLASAVAALEGSTDRPLIWATAQYLSYAQPGSILDIDVTVPVSGRNITQARVVSHVGEREILTANAALGLRDDQPDRQFATAPDAPKPADCEKHEFMWDLGDDLHARFERRDIPRPEGSDEGHSRMWIRPEDDAPMSAGLLAVVADYVPSAISVALDRPAGANSLDNTLRVHRLRPTEWLLCDTRISGMANGFVHGRMYIFAEDGTLLATASQSGILRIH